MLRLFGETGGVSILVRPPQGVVAGGHDLRLAFGEVGGVELARDEAAGANGEGVAADGVAPAFRHAPPAPAKRERVAGVGKPFEQFLPILRLAGRDEEFASGPRELVVVHVVVAVERDLLVGAVLAVGGDGVEEELPAEFRLFEIERGGGGINGLEIRRRADLREGGDGGGGGGGVFGPDDLGVAVVGEDVGLILAGLRVNDEVEAAVGVLEFGDVVGLLFRLLQNIADAVAALGQAEIIEGVGAGNGVGGEHEHVREGGAVYGVFAVVTGVVVAAGDIDHAFVDERIELGRLAVELGRGVAGVGGEVAVFSGNGGPRERKSARRRRHLGGRDVADVVDETGERHDVVRATALLIQPERVGAEERHRDALVDRERERGAEAGDDELVATGRGEGTEIRLEDFLVGRGRVNVADIGAEREGAGVGDGGGAGVDEGEAESGGDVEFAEIAKEGADHGFLRQAGDVALLVDVDRGTVAQRRDRDGVGLARGPELRAGICYGDDLAVGDGGGELEVEAVFDAKIADEERRVKRAALEADGGDRGGRTIDGDGELGERGRIENAVGIDEVPAVDRCGDGGFRIEARDLERGRREDVQRVIADEREGEIEVVDLTRAGGAEGAGERGQSAGECANDSSGQSRAHEKTNGT